jgi:hypothetical protein
MISHRLCLEKGVSEEGARSEEKRREAPIDRSRKEENFKKDAKVINK